MESVPKIEIFYEGEIYMTKLVKLPRGTHEGEIFA